MSPSKSAHASICGVILKIIGCLVVLLLLVSCNREYDDVKYKRIKTVNKADTIKIAVIWDKTVKDFLLVEGVTLAVDEINEKGGLFGRKLQLKVYYSRNDAHELRLAKKVAKDTSVAAVIGHRSSANAIPASIMYEYYGLLYVSPSASNNNLTNHAFAYTFRTIPYDRYVSHKTAVFMRKQGHRNIAIIDDSGVYGKGLADGVMESIGDLGMTTVVRRHYIPGKTNFKQMCAELTHHEFDAVFLGGILPSAAEFIREARQMGLTQCVYGGTAMDSLELTSIAGHAANGTIVPTWFNSELDNPQTSRFVSSFRKRFGKQPDSRAVLGYDSMNILFEAMKRSKSAEPSVVASNMRFIRNWPGVRGTYTFDLQGNLVCDEIYFKYLNQTRFDYFKDPVEDEDDEEDSDPE